MSDETDGAFTRILKGLMRSPDGNALAPGRLADMPKARAEIILTGEQSDTLRNVLKALTRQP